MLENLPSEIKVAFMHVFTGAGEIKTATQQISASVLYFLISFVGRLTFHVGEVRAERRRFWSLHIVWDLFVALGMAFVANAFNAYYNLDGQVAVGVIAVFSYLGPRGVEYYGARLFRRKKV